MITRVICPKCQQKLVLHRPVIDSTRVKCRQCGTKFYAGESQSGETPQQGVATAPASMAAGTNAAPALVAEPPAVSYRHRGHQDESSSGEFHLPKWLVPASVTSLVVVSLAGIFLTPKPPPPTQQTIVIDSPRADAVHSVPSSRPDAASTHLASLPKSEVPRPDGLIGVWELQESNGGSVEFASNGAVHVSAPLLDDKSLAFSSRWFAVHQAGQTFDLELGPEPMQHGNHKLSITLNDDGSLLLTKYSNSAGLNVRERTFKKRK